MARDDSELRSIVRSSGVIAASKHGQKGVNRRTAAFAIPPILVAILGGAVGGTWFGHLPVLGTLLGLVVGLLTILVAVGSVSLARTFRQGARSITGSTGRGAPRQLR